MGQSNSSGEPTRQQGNTGMPSLPGEIVKRLLRVAHDCFAAYKELYRGDFKNIHQLRVEDLDVALFPTNAGKLEVIFMLEGSGFKNVTFTFNDKGQLLKTDS